MNTSSHPITPNSQPSTPNPFQRFYRGQVFDIVCGVVPGVLLGIYSLIISTVSVFSFTTQGSLDDLFGLLMALSTLGAAACAALLVSTFAHARLAPAWRTICIVLLALGILVALISLMVLAVLFLPLGRDALWFLIPLALGGSLSLAAFKQIRLLLRRTP
jgi:hypothetical protein